MTVLRLAVVVLVAVMLQTTLLPGLRPFGYTPDALVLVVLAIALLRGAEAGMVCGFAAGLALELSAQTGALGIWALVLTLVGFVFGDRAEHGAPITPQLLVVYGVAATIAAHVAYALIQYVLDVRPPVGAILGRDVLPATAFAVVLVIPIHLLVRLLLGLPWRGGLRSEAFVEGGPGGVVA